MYIHHSKLGLEFNIEFKDIVNRVNGFNLHEIHVKHIGQLQLMGRGY